MLALRGILLGLFLPALASGEVLLPLGPDDAGIQALMSATDTELPGRLAAAEWAWFLKPLGLPDPAQTQRPAMRHWTSILAERRLIALPAAERQRCLDHLERLLMACPQREIPVLRRFLPAPTALAGLRDAADLAFDRARFHQFLALQMLLAPFGSQEDPRAAIAREALGCLPPDQGLPQAWRPGPFVPVATPSDDDALDQGLAVIWDQVSRSMLIARDPWGSVLWQQSGQPHESITARGQGGAFMEGKGGGYLFCLEDGTILPVTPPADIPWSWPGPVSGGRAFFVHETFRPVTSQPPIPSQHPGVGLRLTSLATPGSTLPPWEVRLMDHQSLIRPLVLGRDALWLGRDHLLMTRNGQPLARFQHDLIHPEEWRFAWKHRQPLLVHRHLGSLLIDDLESWLTRTTDRKARALTLLAAGDRSRVWAEVQADPQASAEVVRLDPLLVPKEIPASLTGLGLLHVLHQRWSTGQTVDRTRLASLATAHPDELLCQDPEISLLPSRWRHTLSGQALGQSLARTPPHPGGRLPITAVPEDYPHPLPILTALRHPEWSNVHRLEDRILLLRDEPTGTVTVLEARHDQSGRLLWRHRWDAPASLPGRQLAAVDGWLLAIEGSSRINLIDPLDGHRPAVHHLSERQCQPSMMAIREPSRLAVVFPPGLDDRLLLITAEQSQEQPLPAAARWVIPWNEGFLVHLLDGRFLTYPGGQECQVPQALHTPHRPLLHPAGLLVPDGLLKYQDS